MLACFNGGHVLYVTLPGGPGLRIHTRGRDHLQRPEGRERTSVVPGPRRQE